MSTWYFHVPGQAERLGPFDDAAARTQAAQTPQALVWRAGMSGWTPLAQVPELAAAGGPPPMPGMPPVPPSAGTHHAMAGRRNDDIDFAIHGQEMQFVEIELDPGESAIAEAGALMFKDASVQMDTVFGDGSHSGNGGGFMDKLLSAGKRVITGENDLSHAAPDIARQWDFKKNGSKTPEKTASAQ